MEKFAKAASKVAMGALVGYEVNDMVHSKSAANQQSPPPAPVVPIQIPAMPANIDNDPKFMLYILIGLLILLGGFIAIRLTRRESRGRSEL